MAQYNYEGVLRAFDPKKVKVTVAGLNIVGFSEEKVMVERSNNSWELTVGCDGEATRVKSNDLSGKITLTLQQTSPSNDFLTTVFYNDQANNEVVRVEILDTSGKSKIVAAKAWIEKMPEASYGKTHSDRQWVFCTNNISYYMAGNYESAIETATQPDPEGSTQFTSRDGDNLAINKKMDPVGVSWNNNGAYPAPEGTPVVSADDDTATGTGA